MSVSLRTLTTSDTVACLACSGFVDAAKTTSRLVPVGGVASGGRQKLTLKLNSLAATTSTVVSSAGRPLASASEAPRHDHPTIRRNATCPSAHVVSGAASSRYVSCPAMPCRVVIAVASAKNLFYEWHATSDSQNGSYKLRWLRRCLARSTLTGYPGTDGL